MQLQLLERYRKYKILSSLTILYLNEGWISKTSYGKSTMEYTASTMWCKTIKTVLASATLRIKILICLTFSRLRCWACQIWYIVISKVVFWIMPCKKTVLSYIQSLPSKMSRLLILQFFWSKINLGCSRTSYRNIIVLIGTYIERNFYGKLWES